MCTPPTVCVDDDLAPSETSIALRATNDEFARRVDVKVRVIAIESNSRLSILQDDLVECPPDHLLLNQPVHFLHAGCCCIWTGVPGNLCSSRSLQRFGMLGRNHNSVNLPW